MLKLNMYCCHSSFINFPMFPFTFSSVHPSRQSIHPFKILSIHPPMAFLHSVLLPSIHFYSIYKGTYMSDVFFSKFYNI